MIKSGLRISQKKNYFRNLITIYLLRSPVLRRHPAANRADVVLALTETDIQRGDRRVRVKPVITCFPCKVQ